MHGDGSKAREQLERLAAEGRARAEAQRAAEAQSREALEQGQLDTEESAATLSTFSTWRSTSAWFDLALWSGVPSVLSLAPAFAFGFLPWSLGGLGVSALFLSLAWWSRRRALAFMRGHPFPLLGYGQALHHPGRASNPFGGEGKQEATIKIVFVDGSSGGETISDRISRGQTVTDALRAQAGDAFHRANHGGRNLVVELVGPAESAIDGHRRWLHRTMRRISPVLLAAHALTPIERVILKGD